MNINNYTSPSWSSRYIPDLIDKKNPVKYIKIYLNSEYLSYKKIYCYDIYRCISELGIIVERPFDIKNIPSIPKNNFEMIINWFVEEFGILKRVYVTDFMVD